MSLNLFFFFAVVIPFVWTATISDAFQPIIARAFTLRHYTSPTCGSTSLFYQTNATDDFPDTSNRISEATTLSIPVIGPLLNTLPLVMGATLWLDPPTPLQWKTLEVCVDALKDKQMGFATIDAAPLVAVLQEGSELASIAVIVGYQRTTDAPRLDTLDSASLRESLAGLSNTPFYQESAKVRLLCIGRARLSNFFTMECNADEVSFANNAGTRTHGRDHDEAEDDPIVTTSAIDPVLMAHMQLILDTSTTRDVNGNEFGSHCSPVHALSHLSILTSRIGFLHRDRQKLVQGIQAVQTRLQMLSQEWQDWDGIGNLYENTQHANSAFDPNAEFHSKLTDMLRLTEGTIDGASLITNAKPLSPKAARLLELNNLGLGSTPSAYCDLQSMTLVLMELLKTYYSPERFETEEFEYSLYSWVALQSTMEYLQGTNEYRAVLAASNTMDRMDLVYESMNSHKDALKELAIAKSQELRDCGEECDLF